MLLCITMEAKTKTKIHKEQTYRCSKGPVLYVPLYQPVQIPALYGADGLDDIQGGCLVRVMPGPKWLPYVVRRRQGLISVCVNERPVGKGKEP